MKQNAEIGTAKSGCSGVSVLRAVAPSVRRLRFWSACFALLCAFLLISSASAQNVFQITSATPAFVPAGANGATLILSGFSPAFAQGSYQVCFYTGYGSTAALTPTPVSSTSASIAVPASTIQGIPTANFTAANGYSVPASIYVVTAGAICDGNIPSNDINYIEPIVEPLIAGLTGSTNVPQTNSATSIQSPPVNLVLNGRGFSSSTVVTFGTFGTVPATLISPTTLAVAVPSAFAASSVGTTASITVCGPSNFCSGAASPVTLTVTALVPSTGTLTVTPTPTTTAGTTTLTAQFKKQNGSQLPEPGVPSGVVTFAANGATVSTAPLTLDSSATLVTQSTVTTVATTATPIITPAAGTYPTSQTINITDATIGATIYYTLDGTTPTTSSAVFMQPFTLNSTATVTAIAASAGAFNSSAAVSAFTIFVPTPTSLSFTAQPTTTATTKPITPAVTVAILDQNGNVVTNSTAAVTLALAANPGEATLGGTLTVNAVNGIATFSNLSITNIASGYTLRATSGSLAPATSSAFNITPYPITVKLFDPLIGVTSTLNGSFTLTNPAPAGGVTVTLVSGNTNLVTVSPATVNVPAGGTTGTFTYTGVAPGATTITASAPNYLAGSANITATYSLVSLSSIPNVAPGQSQSIAVSIAVNAPAGGVTINFTSSNTGVATVTSSVFIPEGLRTPAANPQVYGVAFGTSTISATAQGYAPDTRSVLVTVNAGFSPGGISINRSTAPTNVTITINAPAQSGGLTFNLTSDDTSKVTVPSTVTIPAGQTSAPVAITGIADGSTTIRANTPGVAEARLSVYVTSQLGLYYGDTITGLHLEQVNYISFPVASPTPVTITVTVADPSILKISTSPTTVGSATLTFPNTTSGSNLPALYLQGQSLGSTTVTISGPGYTTGTNTITVYPSGFVFNGGYNSGISTTTFSDPYGLAIYPAILNPTTLTYYTTSRLAPGIGSVSLPVTSSNTNTGTLVTSPIVFAPGDGQQNAAFKPNAAGTTTLALGTPNPSAGFSTSPDYQSFTATVTAPTIGFYYGNRITGVNTQITEYTTLGASAPNPVTVTITASNGTSIVALSKDSTTVGTDTLTFSNITNNPPAFYIQGKATGATTLTISAPGYTTSTTTVTVYPSGFVFNGGYNGGISTSTFSDPYGLGIYPALLNPGTLTYYDTATLSPGVGPITLPVTSSNTTTGTITTSPVTFASGSNYGSASFKPMNAGTTTIALGTPSPSTGFSTPSQYQSFTATVTAPQASFYYGNQITGVNLQITQYVYFPVASPTPVTVTVSLTSGAGNLLLSKDPNTVGTAGPLTFTNVTGSGNVVPFYIQGKAVGSATLTLAATGFSGNTQTVDVRPSGFVFSTNYGGGISTTTFSDPYTLYVYPAILDPTSLNYYDIGTLAPGVGPITIPVTSSNTVVGTITTSPITFAAGQNQRSTTFQPTSAGMSTISLGAPSPATGFSTPANYQAFTATVTAPQASFYYGDQITGYKIQIANYVYLPVAPPNPVTVTVTSNGPAVVALAKDATTVGTSTVTFTNVTTAGTQPAFYIQGLTVGSTTLTVSAPGYTNGSINITVYPSGFTYAGSYAGGLNTTSTSSAVRLPVYPTILNPGSLSYYTTGTLIPGLGSLSVPVTSSNTAVGTTSPNPVIFTNASNESDSAFQPLSAGTSTISITQPAGFATPSQYVQINATVSPGGNP